MTDLEPSQRSWVRRERTTLLVLAALTALVVGLATTLAVRSGDDRPRAAVGDVFIGPDLDDDETTASTKVLLPWARVDASVSEPLQELSWSDRWSDAEHTAPLRPPRGGSFIRVSMAANSDHQMTLFSTMEPLAGMAEAVLTAGGRDYPLNPAGLRLNAAWPMTGLDDFGGTVWVAVAGQPTDASLSITVDGDTQVVADGEVSGGRSDELGALPSPQQVLRMPALRCGRPISVTTDGLTLRGRGLLRCKRTLSVRTPYVDGLGWASEGRDFLVVHLATRTRELQLLGDNDSAWLPQAEHLTATVEGQPSLADGWPTATRVGPTNLEVPTQFVFDVPSDTPVGDLDIAFAFDVAPEDPRHVDSRRGELHWRLPAGNQVGGTR